MSRKTGLALLYGASALAVATCGSVAHAQQAAGPASTAAAGHDVATGNDVIVTATHRQERIHDVPVAVSAVSGQTLQDLKAKTLADFVAFTPGVNFSSVSPGSNEVVIRGVTTGFQLNSSIGLYLDDVPIGSSTPFGAGAQAINVGLFDLQRVEVLSGPQGTLFGANALGGTLRYITETPKLDQFSGQVEGEGSYTEHSEAGGALRGEINAPLGQSVALRVDGIAEDDPGYVEDPSHGRKDLGDARLLNGRASLLFDISPNFDIQLNGFAERVQSNGFDEAMRDPVTHDPTQGAYDQSFASVQPSNEALYLASGVVRWNLGWANFTSITAYQTAINNSISDFAVAYSAILGAPTPIVLLVDVTTKRFTQEARLTSPSGGAFQWVAGAFYSDEQTFQKDVLRNNANSQGTLFGLPIGEFDLPSTARDFSLYGDGTLRITPTLDVTLGARQTWNNEVFSSSGFGLVVNPFAPLTPIVGRGTSDQSIQTYLVNLRWHPTDATMIYGRIASGYRPGGPNLQTGVGAGNLTFAPDKLWNYEVGLKQNLSDRGFLNLDAYDIEWTDIQQVHNIGGVNQLVNAGNARVQGVEALLSYRLLPHLSVLATATYTDAWLTTPAPLLGLSRAGTPLPLTPRFSSALMVNYSFDLPDSVHGMLNVAVRQIGDRNSGFAGGSGFNWGSNYRLAAYTVVDVTMNLDLKDGWQISPYVKNVFDVHGEVTAGTATNQFVPSAPVPVVLSQPRTIGVVLGKSF